MPKQMLIVILVATALDKTEYKKRILPYTLGVLKIDILFVFRDFEVPILSQHTVQYRRGAMVPFSK